MRVLVTGGAGYVGSHAVRLLRAAGHDVCVYDNLSRGHRAAVGDCPLVVGDLADGALLEQTLRAHRAEAVLHFAALALVGESVADPALYYATNVGGSLSLLDAMRRAGVTRLVFSSTTAVYGVPQRLPITEDLPKAPISPYGFTKFVVEQALADYAQAYGFACAALRYFNAAGASPAGGLGEDHAPESHLIPLVLQVALGQREAITVFGHDYPTPDGACIRDYVHVDDLGAAHLLALERVQSGQLLCCNLGTGQGASVRQIIDVCRRVTGHPIPELSGPRRLGDPPELVADATRAQSVLGWAPRCSSLEQIIRTAWDWHRMHPRGYADRS